MGPLMASAIPAIGSGIAGLLGFAGGERANEANARQAQLNRDFQERMRGTQYQTAVADMKAAGLNPALAYQQGGAGTPSGGIGAPAQNSIGAGVSSAISALQTGAQIAATKASIDKTQEETRGIELENSMRRTIQQYELAARLNEALARGAQGSRIGSDEYQTWMRQQMKAELDLTESHARISRMGEQGAQNEARAAGTWWGRNVSPFLNDAKTIGTIGAAVATPSLLFKRGRLLEQGTQFDEETHYSPEDNARFTRRTITPRGRR